MVRVEFQNVTEQDPKFMAPKKLGVTETTVASLKPSPKYSCKDALQGPQDQHLYGAHMSYPMFE
jgi:hypothetical protein